MSLVTIKIESREDVFAALKSDWQRLFAEADCSPFMAWEWVSAWFESLGQKKIPFILTAYRDDRLIGILPMFLEKQTFLGMRYSRLSLMGARFGGADYLDLIARPVDKADALSAVLDFVHNGNYCDVIRFENLAHDSETVGLLQCFSRADTAGFNRSHKSVSATCPGIDLNLGWEAVLSQSSRKANFRRRLRALEKMPGFEYRSVTAPNETAEAFERFLLLHEKRWTGEGGSELSGHPSLIAFQRRLVPELSRAGLVRFDELWVDGECRASAYGLEHGNTFYYYNSGYDTDFARHSVGLVLLGLSIKSAVARGNRFYDFLRGDEKYKVDWANQTNDLVNISLNTNRLSAIAQARFSNSLAGLRNASKMVLPAVATDALGVWRRAWKRNYHAS